MEYGKALTPIPIFRFKGAWNIVKIGADIKSKCTEIFRLNIDGRQKPTSGWCDALFRTFEIDIRSIWFTNETKIYELHYKQLRSIQTTLFSNFYQWLSKVKKKKNTIIAYYM